MAAENRLSAEQLAALAPGDTVCVEISGDFRRPRRSLATVVRIEGSQIVVTSRSPRGVSYVNRYRRRDGARIGGGSRAELVHGDATDSAGTSEGRRGQLRVDATYRAWARNRGDLEKLRELQAAIGHVLGETLV